MKIIHLSDTHILDRYDQQLHGFKPAVRLERAIESINRLHKDAKFIAITGDLVNSSSRDSYLLFRDIIDKSELKVYPILGNHDNREEFLSVFPSYDNDNFVQYDIKIENRVFLFLDTLVEGYCYGDLSNEKLSWLELKLKQHKQYPIYIFMHHHPIESGLYEMDNRAYLHSKDQFWNIVQKYPSIKHISFGHIHRVMHAVRGQISMHSTKSTAFQVAYDMGDKHEYIADKEMPSYAIIDILDDDIRIHHHEYLTENYISEY